MKLEINYVDLAKLYFSLSSDAPIEYGEATALGILGHALGRGVIHLIKPKAVFHNSYILLVGPSTLSRKTTVQELAQEIYCEDRWLPNESSPEKLLVNLSENPEGFVWMGEVSKLLKGIRSRGYMATMAEGLNDLFNCPKKYERDLMKGKVTIENSYLSTNSTITPEVLKENIDSEMFHGGLLPRWLMVDAKPCPKPRGRLPEEVFDHAEALRNLSLIHI